MSLVAILSIVAVGLAILLAVGGASMAIARYRYERPNTRGARFITSTTIILIALVTLSAYAIPSALSIFGRQGQGPTARSPSSHGSPSASSSPQNTASVIVPPPTTGSTTIEIATDFPVTGIDTSVGKPAENGAHLAVDESNANHTIPGYTLQFVPKDDVGPSGIHDPALGANNVNILIGDALVAGIVGPLNSNVVQAEMPPANRAPIALISPSNATACLTQNSSAAYCSGTKDLLPTLRPTGKVTYFRIATPSNYQSVAEADYLFQQKGYQSVYTIDDGENSRNGLVTSFEIEWQKLGGRVLGRSTVQISTTSYVPLLSQIAAGSPPDVIYFGGVDVAGGIAIRQQMQQIPALQNVPFAGSDGIETPTFASMIGLSGGPVYATISLPTATQSASAQDFMSKYQVAYGTPGAYSAAAYDCANILIQAIKRALANGAHTPLNTSDTAGAMMFRQAVISALQNVSYNGVTGHHSFDQNGDTTNKVILIYQLADAGGGQAEWKLITQQAVQ